jgi:phospholipid/cholesterol/gamma-HCH transport system ATP-binding protein
MLRKKTAPGDQGDGPATGLELRNLHKSFGSVDVLRGLDLRFPTGGITTILGPSGAGKTVLLKHMVGLLEPDEGEVWAFGKNIWSVRAAERTALCARMGVLFQDGGLFGSMSVYDNTAMPLREKTRKSDDEIHEIVIRRLTSVGLADALDKMPNEISGGMRKRASFARALVSDPPVVLFDEPDSGLDPVRTSLLNDVILDVHAEREATYVVVTHDVATARKISDYVALIWEGQAVHQGSADEVFASQDPFVRQFLSGETAGPVTMGG